MSRNAAQKLITTIDLQLYDLNNKLSLLEYAQDRGDDVAKEITGLKQEMNDLLKNERLTNAIECWTRNNAKSENPLLGRKAYLLARKRRFSEVEHNSQLLKAGQEVRENITGLQNDYSQIFSELYSPQRAKRQCAQTKMSRLGTELEPVCRRWSQLANEIACKHGYDSYVDACLTSEDLTLHQLTDLFKNWKQERSHQLQASIASLQGAEDLLYLFSTHKARMDEIFNIRNVGDVFSELLFKLGLSLDELPIFIERADIGFPGACYRIEPGTDIRIIVNSQLSGFSSYFYLLHEFGHGMYYYFCPKGSELLVDDQIVRETFADMWTLFLRDKQFLQKIIGVSDKDIATMSMAMSNYFTLRLYLFMRDAMFTVRVLSEPTTPFAELWRMVNDEWLGIDDDSGAFDLYDFLHPLALKNYVFAQVLSEKAMQLKGDCLVSPQMVTRFQEYCRQGNAVEWKTKLKV